MCDIRLLNSHYLDVLEYAFKKSHRPQRHLVDLVKLMPTLQLIQIEQQQVIGSFRQEKPPGKKSQLFADYTV